MGFFDIFKKKHDSDINQEYVNSIVNSIEQIKNAPLSEPLSSDEYIKMREFETDWLEKHYDFNSIEGINSIPVSENLKRPPTSSITGEVYYYMRRKAHEHEEAGNTELAIACMKKSNDLVKLKSYFDKKECYGLVRLLARAGYLEDAENEKNSIDQLYSFKVQTLNKKCFQTVCQEAASFKTDLIIMSVHGATCPECAKYQGRVFSISGKSKLFPKIPTAIASTGTVHNECGHTFHPYIYKVNDPQLEYTLSVHPLQNKSYGRDIVVFSNRPFVDDRTDECKRAAEEAHEKLRVKVEQEKYIEDHMIEYEALRGIDIRNYRWLQENIPDKCPKSVTGYRRMKTQNTRNFQTLKQFAENCGREL